MPRFQYTLEDFYAMSLAAKPTLEAALDAATDPVRRKGLELALRLVVEVPDYARAIHAARERRESELIEKLNEALVRACSPAQGDFRVYVFREEVRVRPLVEAADVWMHRRHPEARGTRSNEFVFARELWPDIRDQIESSGLTIARHPVARLRVADTKTGRSGGEPDLFRRS